MHPTAPATGAPPDNRLLFRFLLVAGAMYLTWFFAYQQWLGPDGRLDAALCSQIAAASTALLQVLGFDAAIAPTDAQLLLMSGQPSVIVFPACNGLVLYALFGGFVLAFPGPWRRKAWFIPAGIALIWSLNVLRVAGLAINHHYSHQTVDFNHHYTFNVVVYGCIFGLWMLWARRLALDNTPPPADAARS
ncbi:archaeosortase/exosortase family protein [Hymenobacter sp. M29]|uniref:Archaeosortase/exosortase family protein n=1 Tax=Hymenobacter mellowenesis TaxID=3063995 RepID=A0ABT9AEW6_9BACT|nr:archaeosortase/exosortase family protein [Hymenobacter sp. M29]MDO7848398.1 archaeosortase/exosortase family protein [Hymenobacter sp. M29]